METLPPKKAIAFELHRSDILTVENHAGGQVCDLVAFAKNDVSERLSGSQTFAFEETTQVGLYNKLWSNCASPLLTIVQDTIGTHDLHLPPCNDRNMAYLNSESRGSNCRNALQEALRPFGVKIHAFDSSLSIFTNITIDPPSGTVVVQSREMIPPGAIKLRAEQDLLVGLSTCSSAVPFGEDQPSIRYQVCADA